MPNVETRCRLCRRVLGPDDPARLVDGRVLCEQCAGLRHPAGCSCGDPDCPEWPYREAKE